MKTSFVKAFVAFVLCLFAMSAMADISTDMKSKFENLTPQQQADMYKQVTDQVQKNKEDTAQQKSDNDEQKQQATIDKVQQYSQLGSSIGLALASTARELGVVANDFLKTPVGLIAVTLIVWKMVGATMIHVLGGIGFMLVFLPIWYAGFKRHCLIKSEVIATDEKGKKTRTVTSHNGGTDCSVGYWIMFFIGIAIVNLIVFTF